MDGRGNDKPIVALVASTGGIDALRRVLAELSPDLPASILVLLHISPDHQSVLAEILARATRLEVLTAQEGVALRPGCVMVAPPGRHLLVTPELCVALIASGAFPPSRPSADLLLTSLALAARERVIAAVLSGNGHDGATGATAVHRFGGTVLATDEASSTAFAMPSATIERDHAIDRIVDLDALGGVLTALVSSRVG